MARRGELLVADHGQEAFDLGGPAGTHGEHLGERRGRGRVEAERRAVEERRREAERMVRMGAVEHAAPEPRIGHEHEVPQRLDE